MECLYEQRAKYTFPLNICIVQGCATGVWDEKLKMSIKLTSFKAVQVNI